MSEHHLLASSQRIRLRTERLFYLFVGCTVLTLVWIGFHQFYLHGRNAEGGPVTQQIMPLVFAHGILMSAWILFFLTQSVLVVSANRRVHMKLGRVGAVLAALLILVGIATALGSVHYNREAYKDFGGARAFLAIPLATILSFGTLVGVGLRNRHRPEVHRPTMLWATVIVTGAALFRMHFTSVLMALTHGSMFFVAWGPVLSFGAMLVVLKWLMMRTFDRYFALGYAAVLATGLLCVRCCSEKHSLEPDCQHYCAIAGRTTIFCEIPQTFVFIDFSDGLSLPEVRTGRGKNRGERSASP